MRSNARNAIHDAPLNVGNVSVKSKRANPPHWDTAGHLILWHISGVWHLKANRRPGGALDLISIFRASFLSLSTKSDFAHKELWLNVQVTVFFSFHLQPKTLPWPQCNIIIRVFYFTVY